MSHLVDKLSKEADKMISYVFASWILISLIASLVCSDIELFNKCLGQVGNHLLPVIPLYGPLLVQN